MPAAAAWLEAWHEEIDLVPGLFVSDNTITNEHGLHIHFHHGAWSDQEVIAAEDSYERSSHVFWVCSQPKRSEVDGDFVKGTVARFYSSFDRPVFWASEPQFPVLSMQFFRKQRPDKEKPYVTGRVSSRWLDGEAWLQYAASWSPRHFDGKPGYWMRGIWHNGAQRQM